MGQIIRELNKRSKAIPTYIAFLTLALHRFNFFFSRFCFSLSPLAFLIAFFNFLHFFIREAPTGELAVEPAREVGGVGGVGGGTYPSN